MPESTAALRPVREEDFPSIAAIHRHYVQNTVITFTTVPPSDDELRSKCHGIHEQGLPYVVAVDHDESVLGFAYASGFRSVKAGYRHTVEMSVFCHPSHTGEGVGSRLLSRFLEILQHPHENRDFAGGNVRPDDSQVRQVIACMSVDETAKRGGLALKEFYERFGFEQVGHLKKVGHKFDRWIDTMYMQKSLS